MGGTEQLPYDVYSPWGCLVYVARPWPRSRRWLLPCWLPVVCCMRAASRGGTRQGASPVTARFAAAAPLLRSP